jgi:hypothetical protein
VRRLPFLPGILALGLALIACNLPSTLATPSQDSNTPAASAIAPSATPSPTPDPGNITPTPGADEVDQLVEALAPYGVTVARSDGLSEAEVEPIYRAVSAYGERILSVAQPELSEGVTPQDAFLKVFGPTVIRVYPGADTVNGVHYALHCGWEGRGSNGCQATSVYPEQEFPEDAWLILFAGNPLGRDGPEVGARLAAHELVHNLTQGGGHDPGNVGGLNYMHFAGEPYGLDHVQAFGVQVGLYAYADEGARAGHEFWRRELTADAVASWGLGDWVGPYAERVSGYLDEYMAAYVNRVLAGT